MHTNINVQLHHLVTRDQWSANSFHVAPEPLSGTHTIRVPCKIAHAPSEQTLSLANTS